MPQVILFNKPYGVLCQFSSSVRHPTLSDYLPQRDVYPAGRLDADSEGLVILTADGALQHRITDPRHKLPKTYFAEVEGVPPATALRQLRVGIDLGDFTTLPARVGLAEPPAWLWPRVPPVRFRRQIPTTWLEITVTEGKNRQVRRMTAAVGCPTLRLIRYRVGAWTIEGVAPGSWGERRVTRPTAAVKTGAHIRLARNAG